MENNIKFSVVLPSYNVSEYIVDFVKGLLVQTYKPFEIIIVEDCSTDNTLELAKQLVASHSDYVKLISHDVNKGLSEARNTGLDVATGDYILFLDADDSVEKTLLENIANAICDNSYEVTPDVVVFNHTEDYYNDKKNVTFSKEFGPDAFVADSRLKLADIATRLESNTRFGYAWNKAYKISMLKENGLRFTVIKHIEDILFNISVWRVIDKAVVIDSIGYHYRNFGQQRLTSKFLPEYFVLQCKRITEFLEMDSYLRGEKKPSIEAMKMKSHDYFRAMSSQVVRLIEHGENKNNIIAFLDREVGSDLYIKMSQVFEPNGMKEKFLYLPFATGRKKQAFCSARLVSFVKKNMGSIFSILKQR